MYSGMLMRLMRPFAVCVFGVRDETRSPIPANTNAPRRDNAARSAIEPRIFTPKMK